MSNMEPIYCFNDTECVYKGKCYNDILGVCEFEWLKAIFKAGAPAPAAPITTQRAPTIQQRQAARSPPAVEARTSTKKDFTPYSTIVSGMKSIKVSGTVKSVNRVELRTKKGVSTVLKVALSNGSERLNLTFWEPDVVEEPKEGDEIMVTGLLGNDPYDNTPQASGYQYAKILFKEG